MYDVEINKKLPRKSKFNSITFKQIFYFRMHHLKNLEIFCYLTTTFFKKIDLIIYIFD